MSSGQQQLERIEEKLASLIAQHEQILRENQKLRKEQANNLSNQQSLKIRVDELETKLGQPGLDTLDCFHPYCILSL